MSGRILRVNIGNPTQLAVNQMPVRPHVAIKAKREILCVDVYSSDEELVPWAERKKRRLHGEPRQPRYPPPASLLKSRVFYC